MSELIDPVDQATQMLEFVKRIDAVTSLPEGQRFGDTKIDAAPIFETPTEVQGLDPQRNWFHLGFCYVLIGIPQSLTEVYAAANGPDLHLETVTTKRPVAALLGAQFESNPWANLIQGAGIPLDQLINFLGTYRFFRKETNREYRIGFQQVQISDPVGDPTKMINVTYGLPISVDKLTGDARAMGLASTGLLPGQPPTFAFFKMDKMP